MRRMRWLAGLIIVLLLLGAVSYKRAAVTAAAVMCLAPSDSVMMQVRLGPQPSPDHHLRPAWTFSYTVIDENRTSESVQVFITPTGRLLGTNPTDLPQRLATWTGHAHDQCRGSG